jgi:hypothetical protein
MRRSTWRRWEQLEAALHEKNGKSVAGIGPRTLATKPIDQPIDLAA